MIKKPNMPLEIKRLQWPIALLLFSAFYWGAKDFFSTVVFLIGFISLGAILGHLFSKQIFGKYDWDVGLRLNQAWKTKGDIHKAILAVGMLFARVLIYIAVLLALILATHLLTGSKAFGSEIPKRAIANLPILSEECDLVWPGVDKTKIAGQVQVESQWKETAKRLEPNGRTSYGAMQVLDSTFLEMREHHKLLTDLQPVWMLQFRYGVRAGLIYDKSMWNMATCKQTDDIRWWWTLRAYNGGPRLLIREIDRAGSCDPIVVDKECKRKVYHYKWGNLDLCKVNTSYWKQVFQYAELYGGYF